MTAPHTAGGVGLLPHLMPGGTGPAAQQLSPPHHYAGAAANSIARTCRRRSLDESMQHAHHTRKARQRRFSIAIGETAGALFPIAEQPSLSPPRTPTSNAGYHGSLQRATPRIRRRSMEVQRPGGGGSWQQQSAAEVAVPRRSSAYEADEAAAPADWWGCAAEDSIRKQQRQATGSFTAPSQLLASAAWAGWGGSQQHQQQPRQQQPQLALAVAALSAIHAEVQHLRVVLDSLLSMEAVAVPGSSPEAKIRLLLRAHQHTMAEALSAQKALERVVQRSAASGPLPAVHPDLVGARASLDAGCGGASSQCFTCYSEPRRPLEERCSRAEAFDDDEEEEGGSSSAAALLQHFGHFAVI